MFKIKFEEQNDIRIVKCEDIYTDWHEHDFLELAYVTEGAARHMLGDKVYTIKEGDYFIIDYRTQHTYTALTEKFSLINCIFRPAFIDKSMMFCNSLSEFMSHYLIKVNVRDLIVNPSEFMFRDEDGRIRKYIDILYEEYEKKDSGYEEMMRCVLIELILHTMRNVAGEFKKDDGMAYILEYINKNYMKKIRLSDIAEELAYSLPHLSNKFREYYGMKFSDYLEKIRCDEAKRILANSNRKIEDVAETVGYKNVDFFYAVFKKTTGMTPGQYRRGMKNE